MTDEAFEAEWERCAPWIEAALEVGPPSHTLADIRAAVERRDARFWAFPNCAVITEVQTWPREKWLLYWFAGGDLTELQAILPALEDYGREQGCCRAYLVGRPGWSKALPGYERVAVTVMKEL